MNYELFINWNPDLIICHLGPIAIRWYSTCWLIGLLLAYLIVKHLYKVQKVADEKFDPLFLYCFIGILIGARLGHCIFYEPGYFLSSGQHMVEMLLPIRFTADGSWHFTGYEGLASHGGTLGIIIALLLYCRNMKMNAWFVVDTISIAVPTTACFIRLGNLMNSEIIGKVTDVPWAFIFERVDMMPRHPGQLYEAIAYFVFFFVGLWLYRRFSQRVGTGFFFGFCLTSIFAFRFIVEFFKEVQELWELAMQHAVGINQGQLLSIPFIALGLYCMLGGKYCRKLGE